MDNQSPQQTNQPEKRHGLLKWTPLMILSLALAIIILDTTILNVSLRTIINDLHTDIQSIQWVITAYSLILAAFTITGGRLGDLFGRKRMFVMGAIIFAIGSFMTSISQSVGFMIAGEAIVEGIGAALMMPATTSLLVSNYQGRDRQVGFGIWGGIAGASAALGPVLGGWLTTYFSWRWAFRVNIFVVVLLIIGSFFITEKKDERKKPNIDFVGVALSALGMLSAVFGFIQASSYGWFFTKDTINILGITFQKGNISPVPFFIVIGIIILTLFAMWEDHLVTKTDRTPLINLNLFRNRQFSTGLVLTALLSLAMTGMSFTIPVFLQGVKKLSAIDTGITMLPMTLTLLIASPLSAIAVKHLPAKRIIQIGLIVDIAGYLLLRAGIYVTASPWALAPGFILFGIGMGLMLSQVSNITLSAVSVREAGEASGLNGTLRQVGSTLGSAIMGAVLLSVLSTNLTKGITNSSVIPDGMKPAIQETVSEQRSEIEFGSGNQVADNRIPQNIVTEIKNISEQATVDANKETLLFGVIFILLGIIISTILPENISFSNEKPVTSGH